jgi:hypothetical protein
VRTWAQTALPDCDSTTAGNPAAVLLMLTSQAPACQLVQAADLRVSRDLLAQSTCLATLWSMHVRGRRSWSCALVPHGTSPCATCCHMQGRTQ